MAKGLGGYWLIFSLRSSKLGKTVQPQIIVFSSRSMLWSIYFWIWGLAGKNLTPLLRSACCKNIYMRLITHQEGITRPAAARTGDLFQPSKVPAATLFTLFKTKLTFSF